MILRALLPIVLLAPLAAAQNLSGRVVDRGGSAVAGARIHLDDATPLEGSSATRPREVLSDADGRFLLTGLERLERPRLVVQQEEHRNLIHVITPYDFGEQGLRLELRPLGEVLVTVRDGSGQPVKGARVELLPERLGGDSVDTQAMTATTDAAGRTRFDGVRAASPDLEVRAPGYFTVRSPAPPSRAAFGRPPDREERTIRLRRERDIAGVVVDRAGRPVPDATVRFWATGLRPEEGIPRLELRTGKDGRFEAKGFEGKARVEVQVEGREGTLETVEMGTGLRVVLGR